MSKEFPPEAAALIVQSLWLKANRATGSETPPQFLSEELGCHPIHTRQALCGVWSTYSGFIYDHVVTKQNVF